MSLKGIYLSHLGDLLDYEAQPHIEGECLLTSVTPVKKSAWRLAIFFLSCLILIGIPYLLTYW